MFVNYLANEISVFIQFVGPEGGGRRTVMSGFEHYAAPRGKVNWSDRAKEAIDAGALFFDFVPPRLGKLDGRTVRLHFTKPADPQAWPHVFERLMKDTDAVVFVADSRRSAMTENLAALRALERHVDRAKTPVVFFFNKRDLADVVPLEELGEALAVGDAPSFAGIATEEGGAPAVMAAVRAALRA